jgi:hypothetical protein
MPHKHQSRRFLSLLIGVCASVVVACSGESVVASTPPVNHDVEGSWSMDFTGTPGNSFILALTESSGSISGTGSFAGEAGPFGALAVSGTVANDSLHLQIIYRFEPTVFPNLHPDTAQFTGVLSTRDKIDGTLTRDGTPRSFELIRLRIGDPPG